MFTDADFFGINFPMDLDVRMKAVMLGACFLIVRYYSTYMFQYHSSFLKIKSIFQDAMFFEKAANQENDRPGMF